MLKKQEIELLPLFIKFIQETENGKRIKKNGKKIKKETVENYKYVKANLTGFIVEWDIKFRLKPFDKLDKREKITERNYWNKFHRQFTDYLYTTKKCHDNYVGLNIKTLRTFFNYLKNDKLISTGDFFKSFYVIKEDIPVI